MASDSSPATADPWFAPVSRHRFAVAAVASIVVAMLTYRIGLRADLAAFVVLGVIGTMLGFIDVALKRLPDPLTLPGALAVLALLAVAAPFMGPVRLLHAIGGLAALWFFYAIQWFIVPGQIGLGDVKLALSLGLVLGWLGLQAFVLGVFAIHILGGLWSLGVLLSRRGGLKSSIPFGPFMLGGTLIAVLVHA